MKKMLNLVAFFVIFIVLNSSNCDPSYPFFIKNNTPDTLFVVFHYNKNILNYSNIDYFDSRFDKLIPGDSINYPSNSKEKKHDYFLIVVKKDTLDKYVSFQDIVSLKKYHEIRFLKDTLNKLDRLIVRKEMLY